MGVLYIVLGFLYNFLGNYVRETIIVITAIVAVLIILYLIGTVVILVRDSFEE